MKSITDGEGRRGHAPPLGPPTPPLAKRIYPPTAHRPAEGR